MEKLRMIHYSIQMYEQNPPTKHKQDQKDYYILFFVNYFIILTLLNIFVMRMILTSKLQKRGCLRKI